MTQGNLVLDPQHFRFFRALKFWSAAQHTEGSGETTFPELWFNPLAIMCVSDTYTPTHT